MKNKNGLLKNMDKKALRYKRRHDFWFKIFKLRFMRKVLRKIIFEVMCSPNYSGDVSELFVVPADFKKLSDEQITHGLNLFVERKELISWQKGTDKTQNADGYYIVLPSQNRSDARISSTKQAKISRIPQEIDLNTVKLEPVPAFEEFGQESTEMLANSINPTQTATESVEEININVQTTDKTNNSTNIFTKQHKPEQKQTTKYVSPFD